MVDLYKRLGLLLCAATGHPTECAEFERQFGDVSILPTPEALDKMPTAQMRFALAGASGLALIADRLTPKSIGERGPHRHDQHILGNPQRQVPPGARHMDPAEIPPRENTALRTPAPDGPATSEISISEGSPAAGMKLPVADGAPAAEGIRDQTRAAIGVGADAGSELVGDRGNVPGEHAAEAGISEAGSGDTGGGGDSPANEGTIQSSGGIDRSQQKLKNSRSAPDTAFTFGRA
jgi:hypothetical protein